MMTPKAVSAHVWRYSFPLTLAAMITLPLVGCGGGSPTASLPQESIPNVTDPSPSPSMDPSLALDPSNPDLLTGQALPTMGAPATRNGALSNTDPNNPLRSGSFMDRYTLSTTGLPVGTGIQVDLTSPGFDTYLQLVDTSTTPPVELDFDDDSGDGTNSRLIFTLQTGKTYQLRVTSFTGGATGSYTLTTKKLSGVRPNDPRYGEQWGFENIGMPNTWGSTDTPKPINPVVVAVLDTGINPNHPDLPPRSNDNARFLGGGTIKSKGQNAANTPNTDSFHGTHVAGTITARTNNSSGVAGMIWGGPAVNTPKTLISVRVLQGAQGSGTFDDIITGIRYSAKLNNSSGLLPNTKADVMNMSLGGSGICVSGLENAIKAATNAGVVVVVAAGNSGDNSPQQPASCPSVTLTVGATDINNQLASFSNFGWNDLSAPGVGILSTWGPGTTYDFLDGTSMATPHVAGAAAMLLAKDPTLTPAQIKSLLKNNARSFGDSRMGTGILRLTPAFNSLGVNLLAELQAAQSKIAETSGNDRVAVRGEIASGADFVPGEILVEFNSAQQAQAATRRLGGAELVRSSDSPDIPVLIRLTTARNGSPQASKKATLDAIQSLLKSPEVVNAYPNYILTQY